MAEWRDIGNEEPGVYDGRRAGCGGPRLSSDFPGIARCSLVHEGGRGREG